MKLLKEKTSPAITFYDNEIWPETTVQLWMVEENEYHLHYLKGGELEKTMIYPSLDRAMYWFEFITKHMKKTNKESSK